MNIISDLHIHSRFSRACSKDITIKNLEKWAKVKGVNLLGTGDFTHKEWYDEINRTTKEDENGILKTGSGFPFIWQTEISLMYSQNGRRSVHLLVLAPNREIVDQITAWLKTKGRIDYDGRPIFGITAPEFVESLMKISKDIEIIPAHIWTSWFGVLGSKSGFNSFEECFQDQIRNIHALETGLSSNPPMNWRVSSLDKFAITSFSDAHSFWPWRLGRETTIFDCNLTYKNIINCIRNKENISTIEVKPEYGKYHFDGHRDCKVSFSPQESRKYRDICPVCKKPLTIGVEHRVEELADRPEGYRPKNAMSFKSLIPLSEVIAFVYNTQAYTKKVQIEYDNLIKNFVSELNILLEVSRENLNKITNKKISDVIILNREGKIKIKPGYDGVYGRLIKPDENVDININKIDQKSLEEF